MSKSGNKKQEAVQLPLKEERRGRREKKEKSPVADTLAALGLFGLAACLFVCFFMSGDAPFCYAMTIGLRGLFGVIGYVFPVLLIFIGILRMLSQKHVLLKSMVSLLFLILLASFINVCAFSLASVEGLGYFEMLPALWTSGQELASGGVLGGALSVPLMQLTGKPIAGILIFVVAAGLLVYVTGFSFVAVFGTQEERIAAREERLLKARAKKQEKEKTEPKPEEKPAAEEKKPKEKVLIDMPGDKEPSFLRKKPVPDSEDELKKNEKTSVRPTDDAADKIPVENEVITKDDILRAKHEVTQEIEKKETETASDYVFPPMDLLASPSRVQQNEDVEKELRETGENLTRILRKFSVETHIVDASRGPTVTRYELAPEEGVRINRITGLADDIALNLAAKGVRIEAPIPGKAAVGIEVPNLNPQIVRLREVLDSEPFRKSESKISVALGKDIAGENVVIDIDKMPHLLVAGATGVGKSVCINTMLISFLYKATPDDVKLILIDPKMVEFNVFQGIPHLLVPVVTDPKKAAGALAWAVMEMDARYEKLAMKNVRDIRGYNRNLEEGEKKMPHIVIVIDELADLMMASPKEVEESVCRLAQKARAAGMHLVIATQRPSADVVTGLIKANIPSRIALAVSSGINSRIILDELGAEKLLGKGDMLYDPLGAPKPIRLQGAFVSDKEVESIVGFIKKNTENKGYDPEIAQRIEKAFRDQQNKGKGKKAVGSDDPGDDSGEDDDEMLEKAIDTVVEIGQASTSMLQRRVGLGYARAARLIDVMEKRKIVGPYQGSKPREVLISPQQWEEMKMNGKKEPDGLVSSDEPTASDVPNEET